VLQKTPRIGRNDPCHCGSGKKFKKCHGAPPKPPIVAYILSVDQTAEGDEMDDEEFETHTKNGVIFPAQDNDGKWLVFKSADHASCFGERFFPGRITRAIGVERLTAEMADYVTAPPGDQTTAVPSKPRKRVFRLANATHKRIERL